MNQKWDQIELVISSNSVIVHNSNTNCVAYDNKGQDHHCVSVANCNNPTINMNFNDSQFASPNDNYKYEDNEFYEQLNYSKMNNQNIANKKGKGPSQAIPQHYNVTMQNQNPWGKQNNGMSTLSQKLSTLTSATMNTQANAIIKTVSIVNPYSDDLSKTTKNMNQPISQQVSRAPSRVGMQSDGEEEDDIDEISHEVQKKKVVKKKIIKRIIKKRNPDGSEAPPQVSTYIIERDGTKSNPNNTFMSTVQQVKNQNQTMAEQIYQTPAQPINYNQTQVDMRQSGIQQQDEVLSQEPKKKVKKIIIKKKKKPSEQDQVDQAQKLQAAQAEKEMLEREEALKKQLQQEQEVKAILEQKLKQQQQQILQQQQLEHQKKDSAKKSVIKLKRSQIKQTSELKQLRTSAPQQEEDDEVDRVQQSKSDKKKRKEESEEEDDDGIDKEETRNPAKLSKTGQKSRNQYKTMNPPKRKREETEEVGQSSDQRSDSDDDRNRKKHHATTQKKNKQPRDSDEDESEEEKVTRKQQRSKQKRANSVMEKKKGDKNAKKQPIKRNGKRNDSDNDDTEQNDDDSGENSEEEDSDGSSGQQESANSEEDDSSEDSHNQRMKNFKKQQVKLQQQQEHLNQKKKDLQRAQIQQQNPQQSKNQPLIQKPLTFKVAVCDPDSYKAYVDQLIFGNKTKDLIMNPIPFQMGQLKFTIERHRSGFNRLHPSYYFYLEKNQGGRVLILYAKKRAFNKTANYLISMEKNKSTRNNDVCLGKLRANPEGDKYILYDNGENFTKISHQQKDKIRTEHGIYSYRYEPCNVGNIRKMIVIVPALTQINLPVGAPIDNTQPLGQDQDGNIVIMTQKMWQPLREQDTMMETFTREGFRNLNYQIFVDNPPAWNPKTNTYVYDFKGRVTQPSIKNFQLIPEQDGRRQVTLQDFVLQFGKNGKDAFILDVQYPFSIFQAFGLSLSAFDTD